MTGLVIKSIIVNSRIRDPRLGNLKKYVSSLPPKGYSIIDAIDNEILGADVRSKTSVILSDFKRMIGRDNKDPLFTLPITFKQNTRIYHANYPQIISTFDNPELLTVYDIDTHPKFEDKAYHVLKILLVCLAAEVSFATRYSSSIPKYLGDGGAEAQHGYLFRVAIESFEDTLKKMFSGCVRFVRSPGKPVVINIITDRLDSFVSFDPNEYKKYRKFIERLSTI